MLRLESEGVHVNELTFGNPGVIETGLHIAEEDGILSGKTIDVVELKETRSHDVSLT